MESPPHAAFVTINGTRTLTVEADRPLLFGLMAGRVFIPSACGGRGSCGQCRVRIKDRTLSYSPAEMSLITAEDRARGIHLSCQVPASDGLSIEIPPAHLSATQHETEVESVRPLTPDISEIVLLVKGETVLSFVPGQYIQVFLPGTEASREPKYRAYSIASSPSSRRRLALVVRKEPGGTVSPFLCDRLSPGDRLAVRGPFGDFHLHESERDALFIAGGSGMAPMRAFLHAMAETGDARKVVFYFSARTLKDLFFVDEMAAFERRLPGFRFIPALSNPRPDEPWDGERGGITAVLDRRLGGLAGHEAYLCGSAGMIDAAVRVLRAKGLPDERIFFDKFL